MLRYLDNWVARRQLQWNWVRGLGRQGVAAAVIDWAFVLAGLLLAQGLASVVTIVIARRVAPVDFGQYVACLTLVNLLVVFPTLGMDNWLLAQGDAETPRISEFWHSALHTRLVLIGGWLVALVGLSLLLPRATYPLYLLLPITAMVAAQSIVALGFSALRLIGQHRRITLLQSTFGLISL